MTAPRTAVPDFGKNVPPDRLLLFGVTSLRRIPRPAVGMFLESTKMRSISTPRPFHRIGLVTVIAVISICVIYFSKSSDNGAHSGSRSPKSPVAISATDSVLIVVDVQKDFWIPEVSGSSPGFESNVKDVLASCRKSGVPILHVRTSYDQNIENFPTKFQQTHDELRLCDPGTEGYEPLDCAVALTDELVFEKGNFDPFSIPEFSTAVEETHARHIYICGMYTDVCVLSTAMTAFNKGYRVTVIEDCCASTPAMHEFVIQRFNDFIFETLKREQFEQRLQKKHS